MTLRQLPPMILAAVALVASPAQVAVAGRCTGADPCYACTKCSTCGHCKSGGTCGSCKPGGDSSSSRLSSSSGVTRPRFEPEPVCSASRNLAASRSAPIERPRVVAMPPSFPGQSRLSPAVRTEARTAPRTQARLAARAAHPPFEMRDWRDLDGNIVARGRMKWRAMDRIRLETPTGDPVEVDARELSEADVAWLEKAQRSPDLVYERGPRATDDE
jgi:hypothetical protein